jgi:D-alanyl-D-alanine carboxypeptidase (penicillin-binding protein 5/6)
VASTQKLLTALLVVERGGLDKAFTIAPSDTTAAPTKMSFKAGQRFTRRELLRVFLVKSANDAGLALARDHSGSTSAFAAAMNRKARQLGAYDSHFVNPHGLTAAGQYSTARDIARIAYSAYQTPFIRETARLRNVTVQGKSYKSTNKLLTRMPECTGLKTGYTSAAGRCLVSTARVRGRNLLLVQLGSKESVIWADAEKLLRWGASRPPLGYSSPLAGSP